MSRALPPQSPTVYCSTLHVPCFLIRLILIVARFVIFEVEQQATLDASEHASDAALTADRQRRQHCGVRQHPLPRPDAVEAGRCVPFQAHLRN